MTQLNHLFETGNEEKPVASTSNHHLNSQVPFYTWQHHQEENNSTRRFFLYLSLMYETERQKQEASSIKASETSLPVHRDLGVSPTEFLSKAPLMGIHAGALS